jgi:DNA-binding transcriptional MerR regulator
VSGPATRPAPTGAARTEGRMNIGEVHARLREEFPSLQLSKLRYFEAEGLVEPSRTPAGYRKYSLADVERLRVALVLQRDHHLPLKVIKEHLEARDRGIEPPPLAGDGSGPRLVVSADGTPTPEAFAADPSTLRLTRRELVAAAGIDEALLRELESFGLVTPRPGPAPYDNDAIVVATTAAELAGFGIEPRHLRTFKTAADREVGLVAQVAAPIRRSREEGAEGRAEEVMSQIAALSVRLHATLVKVGLRGLR